jgi:thymidylate synthase (FAD)
MQVELIDHMGDDLRVVNAARVSFAKESRYEEDHFGSGLPAKDIKLIEYLAKHGHWSPFSHCFLTFRIKAPIFVARQLQKHQVGLAWNEVSRRYVDSEPEFYVPEGWRTRAENVKQGSSAYTMEVNHELRCGDDPTDWADYTEVLKGLYQYMISKGVCPEQARMVLPQSMMTEWYWSGSLYAFARVVKQRTDSHAQKETQEVAKGIAFAAAECFPYAWPALMNN